MEGYDSSSPLFTMKVMVLPVDSDTHQTVIALILVMLIFCSAGTDLNNHLLACVEFSHHLVGALQVDRTGLTKLDFRSDVWFVLGHFR